MVHENYTKRIIARQYLRETYWYVVRKTEVGTEIPADIKAKRLQARIDAEGDIANTEG